MATKEQLEFEVEDLREQNQRLLDENDRLRTELNGARAAGQPNARPVPTEPSFKFSEGERADLEETGRSVSPFTGKVTTKDDNDPGPVPEYV